MFNTGLGILAFMLGTMGCAVMRSGPGGIGAVLNAGFVLFALGLGAMGVAIMQSVTGRTIFSHRVGCTEGCGTAGSSALAIGAASVLTAASGVATGFLASQPSRATSIVNSTMNASFCDLIGILLLCIEGWPV
jgi:hypothetical protein